MGGLDHSSEFKKYTCARTYLSSASQPHLVAEPVRIPRCGWRLSFSCAVAKEQRTNNVRFGIEKHKQPQQTSPYLSQLPPSPSVGCCVPPYRCNPRRFIHNVVSVREGFSDFTVPVRLQGRKVVRIEMRRKHKVLCIVAIDGLPYDLLKRDRTEHRLISIISFIVGQR